MAEERSVDGLAGLRKKIDALDEALVRLLNTRAACALEIGRVKKHAGLPIYQPSREAEVLGHVQEINPGPLDDGAVRRLFERIIDEARRLERLAEGQDDEARRLERLAEGQDLTGEDAGAPRPGNEPADG